MTLETLLTICRAYRDLGDAIGKQLDAVVEDQSEATFREQNPNALRKAANDFLYGAVQDIGKEDQDLQEEAAGLQMTIEDMEREGITGNEPEEDDDE